MTRLCQLDEHRQIGAVENLAVCGRAGPQREVGGRTAEHVGDDDHALASIHVIGGGADLGLFLLAVMLLFDGDGDDAGLVADHMFDRREILPRQPAMCHDDDPDHAAPPAKKGAGAMAPSSSRWRSETAQPSSASASASRPAMATDRCRPPVQPSPIPR